MNTAKALEKAIKVMESRNAKLLEELENAQGSYALAEKKVASESELVVIASSVSKAKDEYHSSIEANVRLRELLELIA